MQNNAYGFDVNICRRGYLVIRGRINVGANVKVDGFDTGQDVEDGVEQDGEDGRPDEYQKRPKSVIHSGGILEVENEAVASQDEKIAQNDDKDFDRIFKDYVKQAEAKFEWAEVVNKDIDGFDGCDANKAGP